MPPAQIPLWCPTGAKRPLQLAVWLLMEEKKCEKYSLLVTNCIFQPVGDGSLSLLRALGNCLAQEPGEANSTASSSGDSQ